jgi:hypothetical protein
MSSSVVRSQRHIKPEPGIKTESVPRRAPSPLSAISPFESPESFTKRVQEDVEEYTLAATELAGPASQATPAGSEAARTSEAASPRRPKNRSKRAASTALPRRSEVISCLPSKDRQSTVGGQIGGMRKG